MRMGLLCLLLMQRMEKEHNNQSVHHVTQSERKKDHLFKSSFGKGNFGKSHHHDQLYHVSSDDGMRDLFIVTHFIQLVSSVVYIPVHHSQRETGDQHTISTYTQTTRITTRHNHHHPHV